MRILIDAHLSGNKITGIGRYLNCLIQHLLKTDMDNIQISILLSEDIDNTHPLSKIEHSNLSIHKAPISKPGLKSQFFLHRILNQVKPDIYHHPHFDLPLFIRQPSVVTIHDLKYIKHPEYFQKQGHIKQIYMKEMMRSSLNRAKKIITVSEYTKQDIHKEFNINPEKIKVVYHGPGLIENVKKPLSEIPEKIKFIINNNKYMLFTGERRPHKNILGLVKAFHKIMPLLKDPVKLIIAGKSYSNYNEPEKYIDKHNLNGQILLTGYLNDSVLQHLYRNAFAFILPSFYEGFGMPLIESMHWGIPVAAADSTCMPEITGDAGLLFNPYDLDQMSECIISLLTNNSLRKTLIQKGKKRSAEFTWQTAAESTISIYKNILENRGIINAPD